MNHPSPTANVNLHGANRFRARSLKAAALGLAASGVSENAAAAIISDLVESGHSGPIRSVRSLDSYIPLGSSADAVLVSEQQIVEAPRELTRPD